MQGALLLGCIGLGCRRVALGTQMAADMTDVAKIGRHAWLCYPPETVSTSET